MAKSFAPPNSIIWIIENDDQLFDNLYLLWATVCIAYMILHFTSIENYSCM